ncbi:MAG: sugar transferase [Anaerolineales bacterium]|nr:sugar transferase [Anaerolineales bacterium]
MLYQIGKRFMDIIGAFLGLLFMAFIYLPMAVAIKLDSPGFVIFAQERVGKDLQHFKCYKFRTMHLNSSGHGRKPVPNDERVTRVGRFLRRTSLDELPQFFNILRGEMSLVGPRPEQLPFLAHYTVGQRQRFVVKPGLTGWWQVNGRKQPMHEHIDEDIYYVEHCSLWLDLIILWRTLGAVLGGKGAV